MSNPFNGPASRFWVRWKRLNLPWRKQRLAGYDLHGNTFWEFKDTVRSDRWRRIARQPRHVDYADIQISPQWHQWLRHTRPDAPSLLEQQADALRLEQVKELAALADARWATQQSYLQSPAPAAEAPAATATATAPAHDIGETRPDPSSRLDTGKARVGQTEPPSARAASDDQRLDTNVEEDPWAKHREVREKQTGGGTWQPEGWTPGTSKTRQ